MMIPMDDADDTDDYTEHPAVMRRAGWQYQMIYVRHVHHTFPRLS
jgi:hypothetical protein